MRPVTPLQERLWPRIDASGPCWLWTGGKGRNGYGKVTRDRNSGTAYVHRVVWEILVGPIPAGADMDHLCRVRACCNPDHLEPVTRAVNVARGSSRAGAPRHTECTNGHRLTPDNTAMNGTGKRTCRTCKNAAARRYRTRKALA